MARAFRILMLMLLVLGCREARRPDVVIVTFDTARADVFGAYGATLGATPATDSVARGGVVFESASAPVPLTLPSHASLFTGMFPPHHGVRENGSSMVPASLVTLAEVFRDAGWETGAFVGAYVLDARWGLDQGFETYEGRFDAARQDVFSLGDLERPANEVVDDALGWIRTRDRTRPLFVWVHLFDPHTPYAPPSPFDRRFGGDPYVGEIAFADSQFGRLLEAFEREKSIIVVAGDHGEAFGEHEERGHGLLLYQEVLRVPLLVAAPGLPSGARVATPVSLVDVFPTVVELAGLRPPVVHGTSLIPLVRGTRRHPTPIYAETLYPRRRFGWSELQVLREGPLKLIESSRPELFDLAADPGEQNDLAATDADRLRQLRGRLRNVVSEFERNAPAAGTQSADEETRARLLALGYVTGSPRAPMVGPLQHPRDKIESFERLNAARAEIASGQHANAEALLAALVIDEPNMLEAHVARGELRLRARQWSAASDAFRAAYALAPEDPAVIAALATADIHSGRSREALELLQVAIRREPREPRFRYVAGRAHLLRGDLASAKKEFETAVELNPRSAAAIVELAGIALVAGDHEAAHDLATRALAIDPRVRGGRLYLAQSLERRSRVDDAWAIANAELSDAPEDFRAAWYLSELAERSGRHDQVERYLRQSIEAEPRFIPAYLRLARLYLERGKSPEQGLQLAQKALELGPKGRDLALAHFLLADFYSRLGRPDLSRRSAEAGKRAQEGR